MSQLDFRQWSIFRINGDAFHCVKCRVGAIYDLSKYAVFPIKMRLLGIGDEELGFVGVGAGVGHGDYTTGVKLGRMVRMVDVK